MSLMDILIKIILYTIHLLTVLNMVARMAYLVVLLLVVIGFMVQIVVLVLYFATTFLLIWLAIFVFVGVKKVDYPGATWDGENPYFVGYNKWEEPPVYNEYIDGETKYGSSLGLLRRSLSGGDWYAGSPSGSRCVYCAHFSADITPIATRGCSDSL